MLERAFLECAFFVVAMGNNQSLMGRPISNGEGQSLMGATRPASVESVGFNSLFLLFPTRDASPPLVLEFCA